MRTDNQHTKKCTLPFWDVQHGWGLVPGSEVWPFLTSRNTSALGLQSVTSKMILSESIAFNLSQAAFNAIASIHDTSAYIKDCIAVGKTVPLTTNKLPLMQLHKYMIQVYTLKIAWQWVNSAFNH